MRIKKFLKTEIPSMEKFNLKKRFPNYFNVKLFRWCWLLLLVLLVWDISLNDWHLTSPTLNCPVDSVEPCVNPFYQCEWSPKDYYLGGAPLCSVVEYPSYYCDFVPCDKEYLTAGERYGRIDLISSHGWLLVLAIVLFAFVMNHIDYLLNRKNVLRLKIK